MKSELVKTKEENELREVERRGMRNWNRIKGGGDRCQAERYQKDMGNLEEGMRKYGRSQLVQTSQSVFGDRTGVDKRRVKGFGAEHGGRGW